MLNRTQNDFFFARMENFSSSDGSAEKWTHKIDMNATFTQVKHHTHNCNTPARDFSLSFKVVFNTWLNSCYFCAWIIVQLQSRGVIFRKCDQQLSRIIDLLSRLSKSIFHHHCRCWKSWAKFNSKPQKKSSHLSHKRELHEVGENWISNFSSSVCQCKSLPTHVRGNNAI